MVPYNIFYERGPEAFEVEQGTEQLNDRVRVKDSAISAISSLARRLYLQQGKHMWKGLAVVALHIPNLTWKFLPPSGKSAVELQDMVRRQSWALLSIHRGGGILNDIDQLRLFSIRRA
jgi:hypothetical protein